MMNVSEIIQALECFSPQFPREALEAASEQKEELIPVLLSKLQGWKGQFCDLPDDHYLHMYGFFLLAEFREKKAYPLIVDLMIEAGEKADILFGDFITESLSNILASVYDGHLEPLLHLINTAADEYVRGAAIQALAILYLDGQLSRGELLAILEKLGRQYLEADQESDFMLDYLAGNLIAQCLDIHATELKDLIEELFDAGLVDQLFVNPDDVEEQFTKEILESSLAKLRELDSHHLVSSTIAEMENWFCFKSEEEQAKEQTKFIDMLGEQLKYASSQRQGGDYLAKSNALGEENSPKGKASPQKKSKQKQQKLSRKKNRKKKR